MISQILHLGFAYNAAALSTDTINQVSANGMEVPTTTRHLMSRVEIWDSCSVSRRPCTRGDIGRTSEVLAPVQVFHKLGAMWSQRSTKEVSDVKDKRLVKLRLPAEARQRLSKGEAHKSKKDYVRKPKHWHARHIIDACPTF